MANYRNIHGINIETVTSNPDNPANGQVWYNSTDQKLRGHVLNPAGAWATGGALNTGRFNVGGLGIQTAAIVFGGEGAGAGLSAANELYNGTAFTEVGDVNTARRFSGGAGTSTAGLAYGGASPSITAATEEFTGETTAANLDTFSTS